MKTKTKTLVVVEIAIVLCSLFLVAIPAIAADQTTQKVGTTASEDDYVLGVYGNANEDDTIDMGDVVYTKLAIFGKKPKTELCDAKYDGRINVLDVIQTKLIILGKEKELTLVDSADRIVTMKKPIERIVLFSSYSLETLRSIGVTPDRVVGVTKNFVVADDIFFSEFCDHPSIGGDIRSPDVEAALAQEPDLIILYAGSHAAQCEHIIETVEAADRGITVLRFDFYSPNTYVDETKKMGYAMNKVEETNEFLDFYQGFINTIKERVEGLSEEDKKTVYLESWSGAWRTQTKNYILEAAGGYNIFGDEPGSHVDIDAEMVIDKDPEIIVKLIGTKSIGGYGLDAGDTTALEEIREEIMTRTGLEYVTAVENGDVYILSWYVFTGPRHIIGMGYMAKWFYPELFADFHPKAAQHEYLTRFQGLDIDFDEKGVFVYPEPS